MSDSQIRNDPDGEGEAVVEGDTAHTTIEVVRNAEAGWDIRPENQPAFSNHPTKEAAIAAGRLRAAEESADLVILDDEIHGIDDTRLGVKAAMFSLTGLLTAVVILMIVIAIIAAATGFGS